MVRLHPDFLEYMRQAISEQEYKPFFALPLMDIYNEPGEYGQNFYNMTRVSIAIIQTILYLFNPIELQVFLNLQMVTIGDCKKVQLVIDKVMADKNFLMYNGQPVTLKQYLATHNEVEYLSASPTDIEREIITEYLVSPRDYRTVRTIELMLSMQVEMVRDKFRDCEGWLAENQKREDLAYITAKYGEHDEKVRPVMRDSYVISNYAE